MEKFVIVIEETVVEKFEVKANNSSEAMDIAAEKYRKGEFVLAPGEVRFKQMAVVSPKNEVTEWNEF